MIAEPLLELGERARVVVDGLGQAARPRRRRPPAPPRARPAGRPAARSADRAGPGRAPRGARRAVASRAPPPSAGQRLVERRGAPGDRLAVLGRGQPRADLVRLARSQAAPPRSRRPRARAGRAGGRPRAGRAPAASRAAGSSRQRSTASAIARAQLVVAAERVEQVALPALVEQPPLVVLAVDLDERTDLVGQPRGGDRRRRRGAPSSARSRSTSRTAISGSGQAVEQRLDPGRRRPRGGRASCRRGRRARGRARRSAGSCRRPVSPVMTLRPASSVSRSRSIRARSVTVSSSSRPDASSLGRVASRRQQLHLVAEQVPERLRALRLDEPDRPLQGADLDDVADRDRQVLATVDRDERLVRVDDPAADDLAAG